MTRHPLVRIERHAELALLLIDNPPVNALSAEVVAQLGAAIDTFEHDRTARALVLACAGRSFVAGGDIASFDDPAFSAAPFNRILARLEGLDRLVVASLHGHALGGGLELALACHWRVATRATRLGLPEVRLGLLPGSLGTQRLPRLVGAELALDLILSGRSLDGAAALACGLIDELADDGDAIEDGLEFARRLLAADRPARRLSQLPIDASRVPAQLFEQARARACAGRDSSPAAAAIVDAVEAAVRLPFEQGEQVEAQAFERLRASAQSKALRHLFFARRRASRIPGLAATPALRPVRSIGVLGGGTMGRGISINFLNAGLPVMLIETTPQALQAAVDGIHQVFQAGVAKGRLTSAQLAGRMALLQTSLDDRALGGCDLVIEAVFEDMALKQAVCRRLGEVCKPQAIIATNTSTLDVDALAAATGRPADVVGMHFFSPAHVMRLLEVVRAGATAPEVLATVMKLAQTIGKQPVVSGVCWGFIGNRMLEPYLREAEFLLLEGASPSQIDQAVEALGLAMGPCRMLDMAGIDVGAKVVIEQDRAGRLPADPGYRVVVRRLFERGRHGQKTGLGYYRYDGRTALADPALDAITSELAAEHRIERRAAIESQEIVERLLYPLINEGVRILQEGIAYRASDIDVVWTSGYGFPEQLGGPMFHADAIGLRHLVDRLAHHAARRGDAHGYWTPAALLTRLADDDGCLHDWTAPP